MRLGTETPTHNINNTASSFNSRRLLGLLAFTLFFAVVFGLASSAAEGQQGIKGGRHALKLGHYDEAISLFRKACNDDPNSPDAHLGLAYALAFEGQFAESRHELSFYQNLLYSAIGKTCSSCEVVKKTLADAISKLAGKAPNPYVAGDVGDVDADLRDLQRRAKIGEGGPAGEEVLSNFAMAIRRGLELGKEASGKRVASDLSFLEKGQAAFGSGDVDQAISLFRTGCNADPNDADLHRALSRALAYKGDFRESEAEMQRYKELANRPYGCYECELIEQALATAAAAAQEVATRGISSVTVEGAVRLLAARAQSAATPTAATMLRNYAAAIEHGYNASKGEASRRLQAYLSSRLDITSALIVSYPEQRPLLEALQEKRTNIFKFFEQDKPGQEGRWGDIKAVWPEADVDLVLTTYRSSGPQEFLNVYLNSEVRDDAAQLSLESLDAIGHYRNFLLYYACYPDLAKYLPPYLQACRIYLQNLINSSNLSPNDKYKQIEHFSKITGVVGEQMEDALGKAETDWKMADDQIIKNALAIAQTDPVRAKGLLDAIDSDSPLKSLAEQKSQWLGQQVSYRKAIDEGYLKNTLSTCLSLAVLTEFEYQSGQIRDRSIDRRRKQYEFMMANEGVPALNSFYRHYGKESLDNLYEKMAKEPYVYITKVPWTKEESVYQQFLHQLFTAATGGE